MEGVFYSSDEPSLGVGRPLPAIPASDVIAMQSHAALIHRHPLSPHRPPDPTAVDPPGQVSQHVIDRPVSFKLEHARQNLPLLLGQRPDELVELAVRRGVGEDAGLSYMGSWTPQAGVNDQLVYDRFICRVWGIRTAHRGALLASVAQRLDR